MLWPLLHTWAWGRHAFLVCTCHASRWFKVTRFKEQKWGLSLSPPLLSFSMKSFITYRSLLQVSPQLIFTLTKWAWRLCRLAPFYRHRSWDSRRTNHSLSSCHCTCERATVLTEAAWPAVCICDIRSMQGCRGPQIIYNGRAFMSQKLANATNQSSPISPTPLENKSISSHWEHERMS